MNIRDCAGYKMMLKETLDEIIRNHLHWLREDCEGWKKMKAILSGANLYRADLSGANLTEATLDRTNLTEATLDGANLTGANLYRADLSGANLYRADLSGANLTGANLSGANLSGAWLNGANLYRADLSGANLYRADLSGANLDGANIEVALLNKFYPIACPEYGSFVGWKKCRNNLIVKLEICEDAKRSSAYSRKCRCSAAKVLEIQNLDGSIADTDSAFSGRDKTFVYKIGNIVSVPDFDEDRRNECSTGIHFFITRQEAVYYIL